MNCTFDRVFDDRLLSHEQVLVEYEKDMDISGKHTMLLYVCLSTNFSTIMTEQLNLKSNSKS